MPPFRIPTCAGAEKAVAPARGPRKQRRQQRFHSMVSAGVAVIMGKLSKGEAALAAKKQKQEEEFVEERKERSAFYQAENKARSASLTIGLIF